MDNKAYAEYFWQNGYLVIEGFFENNLMDKFNKMILDHFGLAPDWAHTEEFLQKAATEVIPWFPYNEGVNDFKVLEKNASFIDLTNKILGEGWDSLYCMIMFSKHGSKGQAWHQDCQPENANQFNLNRLVYTHDITAAIGGETIIYPGSHKLGLLPSGMPDEDFKEQVVLYPKKGTIVLLHGHCWHRVLPIKGNFRTSVNFRAIPRGAPDNITDIAVYRNMRYRFSTSEIIEER